MRYIIIDPEEGIFLGTVRNHQKVMNLFSKENIFEIGKACSWASKEAAYEYKNNYMKPFLKDAFVAEVDSESQYVSIIDILKSGHSKYTYEMINALPMNNTTIH